MKKIEGFLDYFDNPRQLSQFLRTAKTVQGSHSDDMSESDYMALEEGEDIVIKDFQAKLDALENIQSRFCNAYNVVGSRINMSKAMTGNPKAMLYQEKRQKKSKEITLIIDMTLPSYVPSGTIKEIGGRILSVLQKLMLEGNKIELYACCTGYISQLFSNVMLVKLKNFDECLELSRISYALSNPLFLRHTFFQWNGTDKHIKYKYSMGCSIAFEYTTIELSQAFSIELQRKCLYVSFLNYKEIENWSSDKLYDDLMSKYEVLDKTLNF